MTSGLVVVNVVASVVNGRFTVAYYRCSRAGVIRFNDVRRGRGDFGGETFESTGNLRSGTRQIDDLADLFAFYAATGNVRLSNVAGSVCEFG